MPDLTHRQKLCASIALMKSLPLYVFWFLRNQCFKLRNALFRFRVKRLERRIVLLERNVFLVEVCHSGAPNEKLSDGGVEAQSTTEEANRRSLERPVRRSE